MTCVEYFCAEGVHLTAHRMFCYQRDLAWVRVKKLKAFSSASYTGLVTFLHAPRSRGHVGNTAPRLGYGLHDCRRLVSPRTCTHTRTR